MHHRIRIAPAVAIATAASLAAIVAAAARDDAHDRASPPTSRPSENTMVTIRTIDADGKLTAPHGSPKFVLSDDEWRKRLTPEQYRITRSSGTERAFCGGLLNNKEEGMYLCVGCDLPLFRSDAKFESGTGWPSFFQPAAPENVAQVVDRSHGMVRTEINCARCDGHLGHVFEDGPRPTGLRFCLNSEALKFAKADELKNHADAGATTREAR